MVGTVGKDCLGAWAAVAVDESERPQWVWIADLRQSGDEQLGRADPRPSCPRPGTLERVSFDPPRYRIEGSAFVYADDDNGRVTTILGYPTDQLGQVS